MKSNIYNYERRLEFALAALGRARMPDAVRKSILVFDAFLVAEGISISRRLKYLEVLRQMGVHFQKPFIKITREELIHYIGILESKPWTAWTKATWKKTIKRYWKWLKGKQEQYPKEVAWLKTGIPPNQRKSIKSEELISEEETQKLVKAAKHPRDIAFVASLADSGARISEVGTMHIEDVHFDEYGAILNVEGKTGPRPIRIIWSVPYLANWISLHPFKDNPKAPLWITTSNSCRGRQLSYGHFRKLLRYLGRKTGITKKVNPHHFRHSRASGLALHLTDSQMNKHFGWSLGSGMPQTYVHLSSRATDEPLLKMHGMETNTTKKEDTQLRPHVCPRCKTINIPDNAFCRNCGAPQHVRAAIEVEEKKTEAESLLMEVLKEPEMKQALEKVLLKKKLQAGDVLTQVKQAEIPTAQAGSSGDAEQ